MSKPLVLYHANCCDGFCAAWVARKALGDIEAVPVQYGQDPPDVSGRDVYILDFSYKRPVMRQILSRAHRVVILDHHKTAEAELAGIVDEFVQRPDLIASPPSAKLPLVRFDMSKSGGRLAWDYFFGDHYAREFMPESCEDLRPWLVNYTEDRDLWRWKLPHSREINAAIRSYPLDFDLWDRWHNPQGGDIIPAFITEGQAIIRREAQIVADHIQHAREIEMDGHKILAVNATVLFSDIAGELAKGRPFGACYFDRSDGKRQWSLRSTPEGLDVSLIARRRGGGGHRNAAGFEDVIA